MTHEGGMVGLKNVGPPLPSHVGVTMYRNSTGRWVVVESTMADVPEVGDCCGVTCQSADCLLVARVRDMAHY